MTQNSSDESYEGLTDGSGILHDYNDTNHNPPADRTPATNDDIAKLEQLATISDMCGHDASVLSLIARIRSEREQAVRECAEIARTTPSDPFSETRQWSGNAREAITRAILTLIDRGSK